MFPTLHIQNVKLVSYLCRVDSGVVEQCQEPDILNEAASISKTALTIKPFIARVIERLCALV